MKTTDLIPLILLELSESDKYGLEITKSIENKSKGKIVIKQASLYTILKKLEKSRFISSYWQDSEIGGKRHYYKITQNGMLQVSTMPNYDTVLNKALQDSVNADDDNSNSTSETNAEINNNFYQNDKVQTEEKIEETKTNYHSTEENVQTTLDFLQAENENPEPEIVTVKAQSSEQVKTNNSNTANPSPRPSLMDLLLDNQQKETEKVSTSSELKESILPSEEVFASSNIDNKTEAEINSDNINLLTNTELKPEENFASNKGVSKFTNQQSAKVSEDYKNQLKPMYEKSSFSIPTPVSIKQKENETIRYVDYVNIKQNPKYINSKKIVKNMLFKVLSTCAYLLVMLIICASVSNFVTKSTLYNIFIIIGVVALIFYPALFAFNLEKFRIKCQDKSYNYDIKKQAIWAVSIMLAVVVICVIVNICMGNNSIVKLFGFKNFANLYTPILLSTTICIDMLFGYIFLTKKINK